MCTLSSKEEVTNTRCLPAADAHSDSGLSDTHKLRDVTAYRVASNSNPALCYYTHSQNRNNNHIIHSSTAERMQKDLDIFLADCCKLVLHTYNMWRQWLNSDKLL